MQGYKVIVTWEAVYDVAEVAEYIESSFGRARKSMFYGYCVKSVTGKKCLQTNRIIHTLSSF